MFTKQQNPERKKPLRDKKGAPVGTRTPFCEMDFNIFFDFDGLLLLCAFGGRWVFRNAS
jgi:hypothetical protein